MSNKPTQFLVIGLLLIVIGAILKIMKMELLSNTTMVVGLFLEIIAGSVYLYYRMTPKRRS